MSKEPKKVKLGKKVGGHLSGARGRLTQSAIALALALIMGVFITTSFYRCLNHCTLGNLKVSIDADWARAEGEHGVEASARDFLLENIRARRFALRQAPAKATHPQDHIVRTAANAQGAAESAESLAKAISTWINNQTNVSTNSHPSFAVLRTRHWPDLTDADERAIVTMGYFTDGSASSTNMFQTPAAWLVTLGSGVPSVRLLKPDEMPTFGQLLESNRSCVKEGGSLYYAKDRSSVGKLTFSPPGLQSEEFPLVNAGDVQKIEHAWVNWHVQQLRGKIVNSKEKPPPERLREDLRNSALSLYAFAEDINLNLDRVRIVASRAGSFGRAAAHRAQDFYVEFHTSGAASDDLRWSSERFASVVADACRAAVPDAITNRSVETAFYGLFAGLRLDESAKSASGVAFFTVPSVPSFEQFRSSFAERLQANGFDVQLGPAARLGARAAPSAEQEAADQRSNLRLVEVYRPAIGNGSLILFRWFNGPIQWLTVWVFWTTIVLLIWFALIAGYEAINWPRLNKLRPTVLSTAKNWLDKNPSAAQKLRENFRKELLEEAAQQIDLADAKIKWLVWFFPNLGLLGTLFGLGAALGGSDRILAAEKQVDMIMATQYVNGSMSVAFDTTIVGVLATAVFLTVRFWVQWLERWSERKVEHDLMNVLNLSGKNFAKLDSDAHQGGGEG